MPKPWGSVRRHGKDVRVLFWSLLVLRTVVLVLFSVACARAISLRSRMVSPSARAMLTFLASAAAVFAVAELGELVVAVAVVGPDRWETTRAWFELPLVVALVPLAGYGLRVMADVSHGLDRRLTALDVLSNQSDFEVPVLDLGVLTTRERELVELLVSGTLSDDDLGQELSIASATAATHVRNVLRKTGLSSRQQLAVAAAAALGAAPRD